VLTDTLRQLERNGFLERQFDPSIASSCDTSALIADADRLQLFGAALDVLLTDRTTTGSAGALTKLDIYPIRSCSGLAGWYRTRMPNKPGRLRDPDIDDRVLAAARRQLATNGYEAMSLAAVAEEARTTRQALYRRWRDKADLAAAAVVDLADSPTLAAPVDPFTDLVRELVNFQRGVSNQGRLSLVGTMLQDATEPDVRANYQTRVIAPRRTRLRAILLRGIEQGLLDPAGDVDVALTMCTGSWYARALAGAPAPRNWPYRSAALVWRALGGQPPPPSLSSPRHPTPNGKRGA
jgi:AcrR family transcriptional regulator